LDVSSINEWEPAPGTLVSWRASGTSLAKAREAPVTAVPPSYVQARHLRSFREQAARGFEHSRLLIASTEVSGRCDLRAMTYVINAHLRRHDTYRSWFEYHDADQIVRHSIADPADIEFVPSDVGELTTAELRDHIVSTPDSLHWDCFAFGIIQRPDHYTFYASIDHLHADGQFVGVGLLELQVMYVQLVGGKPPIGLPQPGSYTDFCVRQREYTSALTADAPEVRAWVGFAQANGGTYPRFPLPLGDQSVPCGGDLITITLMDERQTERFEAACVAAGARFVGGMFACISIAVHQLTGIATYFAITPKDTRGPADLTTQGWFTGHIPVTVRVAGSCFNAMARDAHASLDAGAGLAQVPFERVVEIEPSLHNPPPLFSLVNFFDAQVAPLSALINIFEGQTVGGHSDGRVTYPLSTMVGRFERTAAGVLFPDNSVARESVTRYLSALRSVCVRVADGGAAERERTVAHLPAQAVC
jgi:hypothetical protein